MPRHALILAAGLGNRLLPLTKDVPKALVPVNGTPIVVQALRNFEAAGVTRARIVVGHLADVFRARLGERQGSVALEYVENPDYATTNSMYSLALGLAGWDEETWMLEGDVFFEPGILAMPVPDDDFLWYADGSARHMDGGFMTTDARGYIDDLKIIREKEGLRPPGHNKSVGLLRLKPSAIAVLRGWLSRGIAEQKTNIYYDLIVKENLGRHPIRLIDVAGKKWFEIDDANDLAKAGRIFGEG